MKQNRDAKLAQAAEKTAKQAAAKAAAEEKERLKKEKAQITCDQLFRTSEFSAWDESGFPIKVADGEKLSKSREKSLRKELAAHVKLRQSYGYEA